MMATDCFDSWWTFALQEEGAYEDDDYTIELNEPSPSSSRSLALSHAPRSSPAFLLPLASCQLPEFLASSTLEWCQHTSDYNSTPCTNQNYKTQRVRYRYLKDPSIHTPHVVENSVVNPKVDNRKHQSKRSLCTRLSRYTSSTKKICCFAQRAKESKATMTERDTDGIFYWIESSGIPLLSTRPPETAQSTFQKTDAATLHKMHAKCDAEKDCLPSLRNKSSLGDGLERRRRSRRKKSKSFQRRPKAKSSVQFFPAYQGRHV